jgi:cellulose synthase (UDP-forming)
MFAFLVFFNFSFSLLISKRILSLFVKPYELSMLQNLTNKPRVAILYTTMNDVVPECLSAIGQTYPSSIYVLDDSTDVEKRKIVDSIAKKKAFKVLRREHRQGFKAGAINSWIKVYGHAYDYIILLDADSYLPPDWVEDALKYAEHPSNSDISIFQGLINIWNLDNRFVKTLAPLHVLGQDTWEKRLGNHLDAVFCYGHNAMIRMSHLREIGGFVEGYVSEDFATAVKLAEKGYKSRFVPIHTYEAMPENIRGFIKRQNKWTRGSMEFLSFTTKPNMSLLQRLLLFQTPMGHFAYIIIMISMLLTIFGYYSTTAHLIAFAVNLITSNLLYILSIPLFQYVIITSIVSGIILRIKLYQLGISNLTFIKYQLLSKAIGAIMLPYEIKTILKYLANRKLVFAVTPKSEKAMSLMETLSISSATILLTFSLILGLVLVNPLGIFYNITWLAPFLVSPLLIYGFSRATRHGIGSAGVGYPTAAANGTSSSITCLYSEPETVNHMLDSVRAKQETAS